MPSSLALRYSPGRELRGENHKRGRSMESGLIVRDKDDDLALFNEMQSKERENFLLQSSDDFENSFYTKLKHFSDSKLGISIPVRGGTSDLLNADEEKNDYEWLLTPPDTPLFPSLDDEPPPAAVARRSRPRTQPISISRSSTMDKSYRSSRGSTSPNRLSPSPRSGNSTFQSRGRPSSAPQSSSKWPATPTRRPSPPPSKSSMPARRSSTPTSRRTSTGSGGTVALSGVRGTSPIKSSRGNSASPKIKAWQSNIPGFSLEAPPNLRTSLADRPASYVRGSSPASRNGRDARVGRQSMSPTASRSAGSSRTHDRDQFSSYSKGSIASSGDDDVDSIQSIPLGGSSHSVIRRLGPFPNNKAPAFNKKSARVLSPSSAPKRSFGSALHHMDHQKSPPNMFRPLLSSVPSTTFYVGKGTSAHRSLMSRNSPVTTSCNASSDQDTSTVLDTVGSDHRHGDMASESEKRPYSNVQEEVFAFDKMDVLNQDASHERRDGSLNILIEDADRDFAIQCDPEHSEDVSHHGLEVEMSSTSDAICDRGDLSEIDAFENTNICAKCGCRYHVIEHIEGEISLCADCNRQHDFVAGDICDLTIVTAENSPALSMKISGDNPSHESETSVPTSNSLLQVTDAVEPWISQHGENIKQSEKFSQENSLGRSLAEGGEQRLGYPQENNQPTIGYSLPDMDTGNQQLLHSGEHSDLNVNTSEVAGISVLLRRSSSSKGPVVLGRAFATIPYEDLCYARDSSNSFRNSSGHGSMSASSSVDFSSSRQTDTCVQRHFSGKKSELENYKCDMNTKPQSFASSLSRSSSNNYQALSLATSTNEENFEGSVGSLKFDEAQEMAVVSQAKVVASENSEADSSFTGADIPKKEGIERNEISRTSNTLTSELLKNNSAVLFPPSEDSVSYENDDDSPSNARILSGVEASAITLDPTLEEHSMLNATPDGVDAAEAAGHNSLATISEIETENSCQSSCSSELDGLYPNSERNKKVPMDLLFTIPSEGDTSASVQEQNTPSHADGILAEESTVLVECRGGSKARSLTLEEATDTILFCSSIVHDLAYQAATLAIEKEASVPLEGSKPTVTILGKSNSDRKDLRGRTVGRRTSKYHKARQRRIETNVKCPSATTENDENADESSIRNVGLPNKVETMKPPSKLESKCNCSIM